MQKFLFHIFLFHQILQFVSISPPTHTQNCCVWNHNYASIKQNVSDILKMEEKIFIHVIVESPLQLQIVQKKTQQQQ